MDKLCKRVYANGMARPRIANPLGPIAARLPAETIAVLRRVAEREQVPLSQLVARLLRDSLVRMGELPAEK